MTWKATRRASAYVREAKGRLKKCGSAVERTRRCCEARQWHRNGLRPFSPIFLGKTDLQESPTPEFWEKVWSHDEQLNKTKDSCTVRVVIQ